MTTTIPFIAYEISGVKLPTYGSGAANKAYVDAQVVAGGGVSNGAFQTLTASTGIHAFTSTVKVSSSVAQTLVVDGYSTISSNAKKAQASAQTALLDADFGTNGIMTRTGVGAYSYLTDNSAQWNSIASSGNEYSAAYSWFTQSGVKLSTHENDTTIHVTATDTAQWNNILASGNEYSAAYNWYTASAQKLTTQAKPAKASAQALKAHSFHAKISSSYLAANYGWAAITTGSKAITHSLAGTPNIINITPSGLVTFAYAVYNPNATNFTVAITAAGSRVIRWHAQI